MSRRNLGKEIICSPAVWYGSLYEMKRKGVILGGEINKPIQLSIGFGRKVNFIDKRKERRMFRRATELLLTSVLCNLVTLLVTCLIFFLLCLLLCLSLSFVFLLTRQAIPPPHSFLFLIGMERTYYNRVESMAVSACERESITVAVDSMLASPLPVMTISRPARSNIDFSFSRKIHYYYQDVGEQ